jgi:ParB family chromosome partitioning protein
MAKLKGLGRGLDALLGDDGSRQSAAETRTTLDVSLLQPGKYQPRTRMDHDSLAQLADSIKAQGVMQPILVRPVPEGKYEIIAGERRWRASKMAGLGEVPVLVREVSDEAALAMSLIENIQRENLNPLEEAAGIQRLIDEFGMTHQTAADAVGRSRTGVTNLLRLQNLAPPVQEMLLHDRLGMGHARALLSLTAAAQIRAAEEIAAKGLSVREAERLVKRLLHPPAPKTPEPDRDVLRLQEELSEKLGARVRLKPGKKGTGRLIIDYVSLEQLDSIISKL